MLELIRSTFAGRRVFVTGHTGFKGSWLTLWLKRLGADVSGYALAPNTTPALYELSGAGCAIDSTLADIRDFDALHAAVARCRPEIVFHLAAQPLVRASYREPVATFATNVMGTTHLLEALRRVGSARAAVVVSSDKCYANEGDAVRMEGFDEASPLGGADPYSSSKACTEMVTEAYRHSFFPAARHAEHGLALASARAGNVIGGGDWAEDRLVPDMIRAFRDHRPAIVRNPAAIRPWQHVLEPLWGYLLLAARLIEEGPRFAQAWNFGPAHEDALTVEALADALAAAWGCNARWERQSAVTSPPPEAAILRLNCRKARSALGWQPLLPIDAGVRQTAAWYRDWNDGADVAERCIEEIARHEAAISRLGVAGT